MKLPCFTLRDFNIYERPEETKRMLWYLVVSGLVVDAVVWSLICWEAG